MTSLRAFAFDAEHRAKVNDHIDEWLPDHFDHLSADMCDAFIEAYDPEQQRLDTFAAGSKEDA